MSDQNNDVPPQVEIIPPGAGSSSAHNAARQSFMHGYLKKAGKITALFAIIGCCFMMFAAWMIVSTFERVLSAASAPMPAITPGK
ncbi:MAG: hypothetical protein SGJ27_23590 [Candidatus Melainabacteria bacterium]|nr:hypothetical protein [Candidatus Melainabacteria bacterium]